ncbi:DUF2852 domain-containing protein [Paracoccus sp. p4-l81]|uniref:DUF2852 domain-containing protein n=1 Tax=unclassified Paracoccus (in: a-proteobacteria) TaxID=2688777 RepID=UPI0035BABD0A
MDLTTAHPPRLRHSPWDHLRHWATTARDWLDARGRGAWLAAMILAFVFVWPLGLALLAYMIWSKRMTCNRHRHSFRRHETGNAAFDAYRAETLRRLEQERDDFVAFLNELRQAKDKAEFDQFMARRDQA